MQSIVNEVLSSIQTNSRTIDDLTPVTSLGASDYFEISGGKKVSYSVLETLLESLSTTEQDTLKTLINKNVLSSVNITVSENSATLSVSAVGKTVSVSVPIATETNAGFMTAADKVRLESAYDDGAEALAAFARLGILPFDRVVYAASELFGAAAGTVAFSVQDHIFVVAGEGGGVSPMEGYNTSIEGNPAPRTDRAYSCAGALYVADPGKRALIRMATMTDIDDASSERPRIKILTEAEYEALTPDEIDPSAIYMTTEDEEGEQ